MLIEYDLPQEALSYVRECLAGGNPLAVRLGQALPLEQGRLFTFLPEGVQIGALLAFRSGGPGEGSVREIKRIVAAFISGYLHGGGAPLAVFEHALADQHDPGVVRLHEKMFFCQSKVYFFAEREEACLSSAESAMRRAETAYLLVGALSSLYPDPVPASSTEVGNEVLDRLAQRTACIIVSAYDGEGYIFWSR